MDKRDTHLFLRREGGPLENCSLLVISLCMYSQNDTYHPPPPPLVTKNLFSPPSVKKILLCILNCSLPTSRGLFLPQLLMLYQLVQVELVRLGVSILRSQLCRMHLLQTIDLVITRRAMLINAHSSSRLPWFPHLTKMVGLQRIIMPSQHLHFPMKFLIFHTKHLCPLLSPLEPRPQLVSINGPLLD